MNRFDRIIGEFGILIHMTFTVLFIKFVDKIPYDFLKLAGIIWIITGTLYVGFKSSSYLEYITFKFEEEKNENK